MTQEQASALISTFASNGDLLPRERGMMVVADTRAKAGMLIAGLLRQIPVGVDRQTEAEHLFNSVTPIGFALECFRWVRHYENKSEEKRVLTDEGEVLVKSILTRRIAEADQDSPLFLSHPKDAPSLYWAWIDGYSLSAVRRTLESHFNSKPEQLDDFLACYVGEAWGVESGLPRVADFSRNQYDSVCALISAEFIVENLRLRYGAELETPQDYPSEAMAQPRRVAHQFMSVHQHVTQEGTT